MATKNRRVATYLPSDVDAKFKEYKEQKSIDGDSEALINILRDYLGVAHQEPEVSYLLLPDLLKRVEALESENFITQGQLDGFKSEVRKDIALTISAQPHAKEKVKSSGEQVAEDSEPDSSPLQLGLVGKAENEDSELPSNLPDGLSGVALSRYLGVDRSTLSGAKKKGREYLLNWSAKKDPNGKSWEYREDEKLYRVVIPL